MEGDCGAKKAVFSKMPSHAFAPFELQKGAKTYSNRAKLLIKAGFLILHETAPPYASNKTCEQSLLNATKRAL